MLQGSPDVMKMSHLAISFILVWLYPSSQSRANKMEDMHTNKHVCGLELLSGVI